MIQTRRWYLAMILKHYSLCGPSKCHPLHVQVLRAHLSPTQSLWTTLELEKKSSWEAMAQACMCYVGCPVVVVEWNCSRLPV